MAMEGERVSLNVYDVSKGVARQLSKTFLGKAIEAIWHTGIMVYGNEYYFGAGRNIQHSPAESMPHGTPVSVIDLGITLVTKHVFEEFLKEISHRYTAETYSLLTCNCNNFSNEVAQFLVGATIPEYILQLPDVIMSSPMGAFMLPMIQNLETAFRSGAVPQVPQFKPSTMQHLQYPIATSTISEKSSSGQNSSFGNSSSRESTTIEKAMPPIEKSLGDGVTWDHLGDARNKVQDEIVKEFALVMATGTTRVSEAVTLATMRVMQRLGQKS